MLFPWYSLICLNSLCKYQSCHHHCTNISQVTRAALLCSFSILQQTRLSEHHAWTALKEHFSCFLSFPQMNIGQNCYWWKHHWGNAYWAADPIESLPLSQILREFLQSSLVFDFSLWCFFLDAYHSRAAFVFVLWTASFKVDIYQDPIANHQAKKFPFLNFTPWRHSPVSSSSNQRPVKQFPISNKLLLYFYAIQEPPNAPTTPLKVRCIKWR